MRSINVTHAGLNESIKHAFEGDNEIVDFYDPSVPVKSIEDVCENIYAKITENHPKAKNIGIFEDNKWIGYFSYEDNLLISFGLNKEHRTDEKLRDFWSKIRERFEGDFNCALFEKNVRAAKWLQKMGMNKVLSNIQIFTTCQL